MRIAAGVVNLIIIGSVILGVVGLLNNNFFPKKVPTEIVLTKSPLQVTYKGNNQVDVIELVNKAKFFPFVDYKFNKKLKISIRTEDNQNSDSKSNTNFKSEIITKDDNVTIQ